MSQRPSSSGLRPVGGATLDLLAEAAAHCVLSMTVQRLLPAGYLDLEYAWWQVWLLWPVIALLVIPASLLASLFLSAFFVECYRHW